MRPRLLGSRRRIERKNKIYRCVSGVVESRSLPSLPVRLQSRGRGLQSMKAKPRIEETERASDPTDSVVLPWDFGRERESLPSARRGSRRRRRSKGASKRLFRESAANCKYLQKESLPSPPRRSREAREREREKERGVGGIGKGPKPRKDPPLLP